MTVTVYPTANGGAGAGGGGSVTPESIAAAADTAGVSTPTMLDFLMGVTAGGSLKKFSADIFADLVRRVYAYDISKHPGVTPGVLANSAARQANYLAIVSAFAYCVSVGSYAGDPSGNRYEVEANGAASVSNSRNVGLQFPANMPGFIGKGFNTFASTRFVQYAVNHPVVTVGDIGPSSVAYTFGGKYYGFITGHGVSQTGQTTAESIVLGNHFGSDFDQIGTSLYFGGGRMSPSIGISVGLSLANFFFSCRTGTMMCQGGQVNLFKHPANGTGSVWDNLYIGGGGLGNREPCSGSVFWLPGNGLQMGTFNQLNLEWCNVAAGAIFRSEADCAVNTLHMEGNKLNGFSPGLMQAVTGTVKIQNFQALNVWIDTAVVSGNPTYVGSYADSRVKIDNLTIKYDGATEQTTNANVRIFGEDTSLVGRHAMIEIGQYCIVGSGISGTIIPDGVLGANSWMPSGATINKFGRYQYYFGLPVVDGSQITLPSGTANCTVYACNENLQVIQSTTFAVNRNLIVSNNYSASGNGSTRAIRKIGDRLYVTCAASATGGGNLLVRDATNTTTYATVAPGTSAILTWNGTDWAA